MKTIKLQYCREWFILLLVLSFTYCCWEQAELTCVSNSRCRRILTSDQESTKEQHSWKRIQNKNGEKSAACRSRERFLVVNEQSTRINSFCCLSALFCGSQMTNGHGVHGVHCFSFGHVRQLKIPPERSVRNNRCTIKQKIFTTNKTRTYKAPSRKSPLQ